MVDCYTDESHPLYPCPCVIPSYTDSGLIHLTCFGQWDISKKGLISAYAFGDCPFGMLP